jgi:hypothetical protein
MRENLEFDSGQKGTFVIAQLLTCPLYLQKRTLVQLVGMSALCQKRTSRLFIRNDRGDLGDKAGATLESHVTPQPGHGDDETIPKAN